MLVFGSAVYEWLLRANHRTNFVRRKLGFPYWSLSAVPRNRDRGLMRIVIATDAAHPQINGVARTLGKTAETLVSFGHTVALITSSSLRSIPCPTYPSIRIAVGARRGVRRMVESCEPDRAHIAAEGPVGHAARSWCLAHRFPFTTSFHTRFPEYIRARAHA